MSCFDAAVRGGPRDGARIRHLSKPIEGELREVTVNTHASRPVVYVYMFCVATWNLTQTRRFLDDRSYYPTLEHDEAF